MAVEPIPTQYMDTLISLKRQYGIQISWLAAVCNQRGWNPNLLTYNLITGWQSLRQFGLAGVWGEVSEIWLEAIPGDTWGAGRACGYTDNPCGKVPLNVAYPAAGWFPWLICGVICGVAQPTLVPAPLVTSYIAGELTVLRNLTLASTILLDSATWVQGKCGELNSLVFARYILGWRMPWVYDVSGKCVIPPNLPPWVATEVDELVAAQAIYADQLGEPPIVPPTVECDATHPCPSPLICVNGYCVLPSGGGISPLAWGLLGLFGLVGLVGLLSSKSARPQSLRQAAAQLRGRAASLRTQAGEARGRGDFERAGVLENQASDLERRATDLENEATRRETAATQAEYARTQGRYQYQ